jgi:hypothetical protein
VLVLSKLPLRNDVVTAPGAGLQVPATRAIGSKESPQPFARNVMPPLGAGRKGWQERLRAKENIAVERRRSIPNYPTQVEATNLGLSGQIIGATTFLPSDLNRPPLSVREISAKATAVR